MTDIPQHAVENLFSVIPHAVSPATTEEYGLAVSPDHARQITREVLSLSLFWIGCALRVSLSETVAKQLSHDLHARIRTAWETAFDLSGDHIDEYFQEMAQRHAAWNAISCQGGESMMILSDAASLLEEAGAISYGDRQNMLGFLLDAVPIDGIGETVAQIEHELAGT